MKEHRNTWTPPWKYKEGFFLAIGLFIVGLTLEFITWPQGIPRLRWPMNLISGAVFLLFIILLHVFLRKKQFVIWLATVPASIVSIIYFTFLVFIMGFSPQEDKLVAEWTQKIGFSHMASSWTLLLAQLFLLTSLGLVTIKRLFPFKGKNIGFFLNHAGLWIVIMAGTLGTADFYRLSVPIVEGKGFTPIAYDENNNKLHLPFALALNNFEIEEYTPELGLYNIQKRNYTGDLGPFPHAVVGSQFQYASWKIKVEEHLPFALLSKISNEYEKSNKVGAVHAVKVKAVNFISSDTITGWVTNGNFIMKPRFLPLDDSISVVLHQADIKAFRSYIKWRTKDNKTDSAVVEVNKPVKIGAWKVYQASYDSKAGRWSNYSVLEAITDYWLPAVYVGIFMMLAGAVYLFWQGREFRKIKEEADE